MSVFISDILKLPIMQGAEVLGGKSALSKIVSAVTVLEYAEPELLHEVTHGKDYYRNEIGITGFLNCPADVERQVACIRKMAEEGEVGLILCYVGLFMPTVDQRLIDAANESDFALICMPEKNLSLRYSDIIYEIMELVFKDQSAQHTFVYDILDHVSSLRKEQQTIRTVLGMLGDKLASTVILTDAAHKIIYQVNWRDTKPDKLFQLNEEHIPVLDGIPIKYEEDQKYWMYRLSVKDKKNTGTELFILKQNKTLEEEQRSQAVELIRLALSIWGDRHGEEVIEELVHAILNDKPTKVKRLAELFRVDTASINSLWVLHSEKKEGISEEAVKSLKKMIGMYTNIIIDDYYENDYVIFSGELEYKDERELRHLLWEKQQEDLKQISVIYCGHMMNTAAVRKAYLLTRKNIQETCRVFSHRGLYTLNDIAFIGTCKSAMEQGEQFLKEMLQPIQCLEELKQKELLDTLMVYLLDAEMSVQFTGELQYLHKNTVKYRIQRIADLTGIRPGEMPGTIALYRAVVTKRLLDI